MKLANIPEIFEAFNRLKVLIIGDVMLDSYIFGSVNRISPEAPVPVVNVNKRDVRLGGAGNVAINIKALGATPYLCSVVGDDTDSDVLLKLLTDNELPTDGIIKSEGRMTTVKQRILAGSQHVIRIDSEIDSPINTQEEVLLVQKAEELAKICDVIIFEDYDKGVLTSASIQAIVKWAKENGVPTIVDPKKRNFLHYAGVDIFKPNLKELREGLQMKISTDNIEDLNKSVSLAKEKLGVGGLLLTLSEKGVYIDFKEEKHHIDAHIRQIADVSGAGDTVVSIAAACLAMGLSPKQIAEISNLGGGLVCEHIGVVPIDKKQLLAEAMKI